MWILTSRAYRDRVAHIVDREGPSWCVVYVSSYPLQRWRYRY
jgi:hypothetical protein